MSRYASTEPRRIGPYAGQSLPDCGLKRAINAAGALEVRVYRLGPLTWQFVGSRVNFTTLVPDLVTWSDLRGLASSVEGGMQ